MRIQNNLSTPWTAGLTLGSATGRYFVGFSEFCYTRAADAVFTAATPLYPYGWSDLKIGMKADLYEITFGGHVNVPLRRIVPYAGAGAGVMWVRARVRYLDDDSDVLEPVINSTVSEGDWVAFFATGARVFATKRFGVRPEFRVVYMPDSRYYRFTIGVFGRF